MKIAILGTRGIPNNYGGFEQFAEYISVGLVKKGHQVTVYNPHFHPYGEATFNGVSIIKINSPEDKIGAAGNFIYDYRCLKDAIRRDFDIIYEAGYGTCSPFFYLVRGHEARLITNMDGLEWKRSKWNYVTRQLMKYFEYLAVKKSHYLISDNLGIKEYYKNNFNKDSFYLAYGADPIDVPDIDLLNNYHLKKKDYLMLIARFEPENNLEMILDAYQASERQEPFLVIGNYKTKYGSYLLQRYKSDRIHFLGGIYNKAILDSLRYYAKAYLHGHTVGGTNPSLLEAMASNAFIIAHENPFNSSVLKSNALYFNSVECLRELFTHLDESCRLNEDIFIKNNREEIEKHYNWSHIVDQHEDIFNEILL